jgi:hypothetical protein
MMGASYGTIFRVDHDPAGAFTTLLCTLSVHHQREVRLWTALEARVAAAPNQFIPEEIQYLDSLKPTSFVIKGGALVIADLLVILVMWMSPKARQE